LVCQCFLSDDRLTISYEEFFMEKRLDLELVEYRKWLIAAEQKAQEDYDKTVLALSGGALGISFAFIKDVIGNQPAIFPHLLWGSWLAWGLSVAFVLVSFYASRLALRRTIVQIDQGQVYREFPGGYYATMTAWLNLGGGILFLAGVVLIVIFAAYNMK
jgi:hypothetical protein